MCIRDSVPEGLEHGLNRFDSNSDPTLCAIIIAEHLNFQLIVPLIAHHRQNDNDASVFTEYSSHSSVTCTNKKMRTKNIHRYPTSKLGFHASQYREHELLFHNQVVIIRTESPFGHKNQSLQVHRPQVETWVLHAVQTFNTDPRFQSGIGTPSG